MNVEQGMLSIKTFEGFSVAVVLSFIHSMVNITHLTAQQSLQKINQYSTDIDGYRAMCTQLKSSPQHSFHMADKWSVSTSVSLQPVSFSISHNWWSMLRIRVFRVILFPTRAIRQHIAWRQWNRRAYIEDAQPRLSRLCTSALNRVKPQQTIY